MLRQHCEPTSYYHRQLRKSQAARWDELMLHWKSEASCLTWSSAESVLDSDLYQISGSKQRSLSERSTNTGYCSQRNLISSGTFQTLIHFSAVFRCNQPSQKSADSERLSEWVGRKTVFPMGIIRDPDTELHIKKTQSDCGVWISCFH